MSAIAWIILYGLVFVLGGMLPGSAGFSGLPTCVLLTAYVAALLGWIAKRGKAADLGLRVPRGDLKILCALWLPCLVIPLLNVAMVPGALNFMHLQAGGLYLFALSAFLEELLFRGYLIGKIEERFACSSGVAVVVSAIAFGALHLANLGSASLVLVLLQALFAMIMGIYFGICTVQSRSIVLAIVAHFVVNFAANLVAPAVSVPSVAILLGDIARCLVLIVAALALAAWAGVIIKRDISIERNDAASKGAISEDVTNEDAACEGVTNEDAACRDSSSMGAASRDTIGRDTTGTGVANEDAACKGSSSTGEACGDSSSMGAASTGVACGDAAIGGIVGGCPADKTNVKENLGTLH